MKKFVRFLLPCLAMILRSIGIKALVFTMLVSYENVVFAVELFGPNYPDRINVQITPQQRVINLGKGMAKGVGGVARCAVSSAGGAVAGALVGTGCGALLGARYCIFGHNIGIIMPTLGAAGGAVGGTVVGTVCGGLISMGTMRSAGRDIHSAFTGIRNVAIQKLDANNISIFVCLTESNSPDTDCSICQEEITNGVRTQCEHDFHRECIADWVKTKPICPNCRQPLTVTN